MSTPIIMIGPTDITTCVRLHVAVDTAPWSSRAARPMRRRAAVPQARALSGWARRAERVFAYWRCVSAVPAAGWPAACHHGLRPAGHQEPQGGFLPPRQRRIWVRFSDGSWRPCDVLAWAKARAIMSDRPYWMIRLRLLADGTGGTSAGWFVYDPEHIEVR